MLDAAIEISLFAFPLAAVCFGLGWWTSKKFSAKPSLAAPPSPVPRVNASRPDQQAEFLIKNLRSELLQMRTELEAQRARARELELLAELSENRPTLPADSLPKAMATDNPTLPVASGEWAIIVLKQRIRDLEKALEENKR
jgi:hypothetical protein